MEALNLGLTGTLLRRSTYCAVSFHSDLSEVMLPCSINSSPVFSSLLVPTITEDKRTKGIMMNLVARTHTNDEGVLLSKGIQTGDRLPRVGSESTLTCYLLTPTVPVRANEHLLNTLNL